MQEAVVKEADVFWRYAREAACSASEAISENEKRALLGLACTWGQAALMSNKELESSFVLPPRDSDNIALVPDTQLA
jgi:hypothetical protein